MEQRWRAVLSVVLGAVVGLGIGAGAYVALAAMLEGAGGLEELQGFAWNLVPLGTVGGAVLGWVLSRRGDGDR